jgi:hypothetical protein
MLTEAFNKWPERCSTGGTGSASAQAVQAWFQQQRACMLPSCSQYLVLLPISHLPNSLLYPLFSSSYIFSLTKLSSGFSLQNPALFFPNPLHNLCLNVPPLPWLSP